MVDSPFNYEAALSACAQGDAQAFQQLYEQEAPRMLALANIMLNDQAAAQNTVHDAFVLIWKNADSYDPRTGNACAWIYSIMRYRTLSLLRRNPPSLSQPAATPSHNTTGLTAFLSRQPEILRKPVLMAFYNGMDYTELATRLGCSVSELRSRTRACLRAIREFSAA